MQTKQEVGQLYSTANLALNAGLTAGNVTDADAAAASCYRPTS